MVAGETDTAPALGEPLARTSNTDRRCVAVVVADDVAVGV